MLIDFRKNSPEHAFPHIRSCHSPPVPSVMNDPDMPFCTDKVFFVMLGHHFVSAHGSRMSADDVDAQFVLMCWVTMVAMATQLIEFRDATRRSYNRPECMLSSYVNSVQWRESGVFRRKLRMTYQSFTLLCDSLRDAISDSFCGLTGVLLKTRQFQVAVGISGKRARKVSDVVFPSFFFTLTTVLTDLTAVVPRRTVKMPGLCCTNAKFKTM